MLTIMDSYQQLLRACFEYESGSQGRRSPVITSPNHNMLWSEFQKSGAWVTTFQAGWRPRMRVFPATTAQHVGPCRFRRDEARSTAQCPREILANQSLNNALTCSDNPATVHPMDTAAQVHQTAVVKHDAVCGYQPRPFARTNGRPASWSAKCACGWFGPARHAKYAAQGDADAHAAGVGPK